MEALGTGARPHPERDADRSAVLDRFQQALTEFDRLIATANDRPALTLLDDIEAITSLTWQLHARKTQLIATAHHRGAASAHGAVSTAAWLRNRLRMGHEASITMRHARLLTRMPALAAAHAEGTCGPDHLSAIAAVAADLPDQALADGGDEILAKAAASLTPTQLGHAALRLREHVNTDAARKGARDRYQERRLSASRTIGGAVAVQGLLDPDGGELLIQALGAFTPPPRPGEDRTPAQRRADALVQICRNAGASTDGGERPHITLIWPMSPQPDQTGSEDAPCGPTNIRPTNISSRPTQPKQLGRGRAGIPSNGAILGGKTPLHGETTRRLACDAIVIPAFVDTHGQPLSLGRAQRLISKAQRRALTVRDGGCRFPDCDRPPEWTDGHHVVPWSIGGPTDLTNLILMCRHHHVLIHEGGWRLSYHATTNTVTVARPDGTPHDRIGLPP